MRLVDSTSWGALVHPCSESSFVVEVNKGQCLDTILMELKDSVLIKMNEFFALGGDDMLRYQNRLCVLYMDDLKTGIVAKAYGSRYFICPGSTKMYQDLKQIYWWDGIEKDIKDYVANCPNCQ